MFLFMSTDRNIYIVIVILIRYNENTMQKMWT